MLRDAQIIGCADMPQYADIIILYYINICNYITYTDLVNVFILYLYFILIYIIYRGLVLYIFKTVLNLF